MDPGCTSHGHAWRPSPDPTWGWASIPPVLETVATIPSIPAVAASSVRSPVDANASVSGPGESACAPA